MASKKSSKQRSSISRQVGSATSIRSDSSGLESSTNQSGLGRAEGTRRSDQGSQDSWTSGKESVNSSQRSKGEAQKDNASSRNTLDKVSGLGEALLGKALSGMIDRASSMTANTIASSEQDYDTGVGVSVEQIASGSLSASELASVGMSGNAEQRAYASAAMADKQAEAVSRQSASASNSTSDSSDSFSSSASKNNAFSGSGSALGTEGVGGAGLVNAGGSFATSRGMDFSPNGTRTSISGEESSMAGSSSNSEARTAGGSFASMSSSRLGANFASGEGFGISGQGVGVDFSRADSSSNSFAQSAGGSVGNMRGDALDSSGFSTGFDSSSSSSSSKDGSLGTQEAGGSFRTMNGEQFGQGFSTGFESASESMSNSLSRLDALQAVLNDPEFRGMDKSSLQEFAQRSDLSEAQSLAANSLISRLEQAQLNSSSADAVQNTLIEAQNQTRAVQDALSEIRQLGLDKAELKEMASAQNLSSAQAMALNAVVERMERAEFKDKPAESAIADALTQAHVTGKTLSDLRGMDLDKNSLQEFVQSPNFTTAQSQVANSILAEIQAAERSAPTSSLVSGNGSPVLSGDGTPIQVGGLVSVEQDLATKVEALRKAFEAEAEAFAQAAREGTPEAQSALGNAMLATAQARSELPANLQAAFETSPAFSLSAAESQGAVRQDATAEDVLALRTLVSEANQTYNIAQQGAVLSADAVYGDRLEKMTDQERRDLATELRGLANAAQEPSLQAQLNSMAASAEVGDKASLAELTSELTHYQREQEDVLQSLVTTLDEATQSLGPQEAEVLSRVDAHLLRQEAKEILREGESDTRAQYGATAVLTGALIDALPAGEKLEALTTLEAASENIRNAKPNSPDALALSDALASLPKDSMALQDAVQLTDAYGSKYSGIWADLPASEKTELAQTIREAAEALRQDFPVEKSLAAADAMDKAATALENGYSAEFSSSMRQAQGSLDKVTDELTHEAFNSLVPMLSSLGAHRDVLDASYVETPTESNYTVNTPSISLAAQSRDVALEETRVESALDSVRDAMAQQEMEIDIELDVELDMGGD